MVYAPAPILIRESGGACRLCHGGIHEEGFVRSILVALSANAAQAAPITYTAVLSGANEVPAIPTTGTGSATIIYDAVTHLLGLDINFANLVSPTTASHIHCCALQPGNNAGVATTTPTFAGFPLGVTSGTYVNTLDLTLASSWNPSFITSAFAGGTIAGAEAALAADWPLT